MRKETRKPSIPRKLFGSGMEAVGIALAPWSNDEYFSCNSLWRRRSKITHSGVEIDPLGNKRIDGIEIYQQDRVAKTVDKVEAFWH